MSAINKALDEIKFKIPRQILDLAFQDEQYSWRRMPISIDEQISNRILKPRVLIDCNLVGGIINNIPLDNLSPVFVDNYNLIYQIPKELTMGRNIVSVLSVGYSPYAASFNSAGVGYGNVSPSTMNEVSNVAQRVGDAMSSIPPICNARVNLIAENTVLIRDQSRVTSAYSLRCVLENDENLNNISVRSWHTFSELCVLAVKSYIYNTLIIKIDQAYIVGGQELGSVKTYVESFSDAEEMYSTFLKEVWRSTAFMNDGISYDRFIKMQINPAL